ncbi:hypothetical protein OZZ08_00765 [Malaciobacter mytili]|uniref:hypothetical protein n=1 Tax=Malaciobacter mytili TaxID=603050 RepID=UPI003BAE78F7
MLRKILLLTILPFFLFAYNEANVAKGQTYYKFIIYPILNIKGDEFTKLYTKKQWEELFLNNAQGLKQKYSSNKKFCQFLDTEKFETIQPYLKSFVLYYAKDSKVVAQCSE